jgi:hypothetical protein
MRHCLSNHADRKVLQSSNTKLREPVNPAHLFTYTSLTWHAEWVFVEKPAPADKLRK